MFKAIKRIIPATTSIPVGNSVEFEIHGALHDLCYR